MGQDYAGEIMKRAKIQLIITSMGLNSDKTEREKHNHQQSLLMLQGEALQRHFAFHSPLTSSVLLLRPLHSSHFARATLNYSFNLE
jgi:hypothetical protein